MPCRIKLICLFTLFSIQYLHAQFPKREFRGVWIATVANIDWPSKSGLSSDEQKKEFIDLLNFEKSLGMNAVIVQVRPSADAFYASRLEPWSIWLTGKLGQYPDSYYDPLTFMVEEAHKRGLEFHAWFNPYRAGVNVNDQKLDSASIFFQHSEWFVHYGKNIYFNPGLPEAREHVIKVIMDVVHRYNIDGVHFDDYFYPYKIADATFPDSLTFVGHANRFHDIGDWRRNNVDQLIERLSDSIKTCKPHVVFGVSPFGVWRNHSSDSLGSLTHAGQTSYDDLYANVVKWMKNGWLDYVMPQLYWSIGYQPADYEVLAKWWNENSFGKSVIIGHGAYKINSNSDHKWRNPEELLDQIDLNRSLSNINGSAFFSAKSFLSNPLGIADLLKTRAYKTKALPLQYIHLDSGHNEAQYSLTFTQYGEHVQLMWQEKTSRKLSSHAKYVIYRFDGIDTNLNDTKAILDVIPDTNAEYSSVQKYIDSTAKKGKKYTYVVTSLDQFNCESRPQFGYSVKIRSKGWQTYAPVSLGKKRG